ncbi:hypothetical protein CEXT_688131 [Caerostris extrusa]|uniref:Uncharacterized protein n=1 Tax=Caerostris extrusa TaxID=172846 RepID=A0AAV4Y5A4_CAEEX|nr:hypothetical protein CEXT_688131 [Caerostris extrusa]
MNSKVYKESDPVTVRFRTAFLGGGPGDLDSDVEAAENAFRGTPPPRGGRLKSERGVCRSSDQGDFRDCDL